nr:putative ribonuclease H-like domain-containing protein [Tanacetum cinerariifolium]
DSHEAPKDNAASASDGAAKRKGRTAAMTTNDMQKRKNDVKARTTLLLALPDEHQLRFIKYKTTQELWAAILKTFSGNEATKKTKKNLLKQQYGNFKAEGIETLKQTFNRLQVIVSHLEFMDIEIKQDDLNQKFLTSLAPEWLIHTIVWRNRSDLDTMSLDDLYNHLKKKTGKKITIQGTDVARFDKSKVECFNCHKMGHFTRECRAPRSQDRGRRDNYRQWSKVEEQAPKALMAIDGVGWDWSFMANKEEDHALVANEETPTEFALMAKTSADSEVFDNSLCSKTCKKNTDSLNSKITELIDKLSDTKTTLYHYKLGLSQVEARLVEFKNQEVKYCEKIRGLEFKVESRGDIIECLTNELELLKKEKEGLESKLTGFLSASKDLYSLLDSQRLDKNKEGPSPAKESTSDDVQNIITSDTKTEASPSTISPKPFIKFVKATDKPTENKTDKVETAKKPPVKYAEQYRKPSKKSNVRGEPKKLEQFEVLTVRKFPTGSTKFSTVDIGKKGNAVKASTCYWDSGCSWHMTCNISYLSDYEPFDGGYVSFGQGECKITGKGIIKTGKLEFENMYFVKDLKDFKLIDDTNVLLRTPRQHNMYFVDLNNIVPHKDLTCLVAKASADECMLWHRRLGSSIKRLTFFLKTKDETSGILRNFITEIENLKELKVKIIKCDNGGEFRKKEMNDFCSRKVNTACYVQNRVLVNKSQNKTPYELFNGRTPAIGFLKPLGCHVMILNTLDNLGKFEAKGDEGYFIGYYMSSKAFRVFNKRTKRVEENLHVDFLENKAIEKGVGLNWLFDIDSLTNSMNYIPMVGAVTHSTNFLDTCKVDALESSENPNPTASTTNPQADPMETLAVETPIPAVSSPVLTACLNDSPKLSSDTRLIFKRVTSQDDTPSLDNILTLTNRFEDILGVTTNTDDTHREEADIGNMETTITASPTPTLRIYKDHLKSQIISPVDTPVFKNKKDEKGIVIKNKARLVAQGNTQEERIDYDEVFAPVARIEAIRLFLAYASFMGFIVHQMDVKSAFLYGIIDEEVYVMQPPRFQDPKFLARVYKVEKVMYGLHQAPRAWQRGDFILVQVYVDDIIFGSSNPQLCREFEAFMHENFQMSVMDIMFAVCACATHQVTPKECHLHAVKRIFRYLKGHPKLGLWYPKESPFDLVAYSDSDYDGATQDRKSTTRGCQLLGRRLISWHCKKQTINADFHLIVDFVEASHIRYALTFNPTVYVCHIRQFWSTTRIETTKEGTKILATVDDKLRTVFESSYRRNLKLHDVAGISSLLNVELFENLTLMGYNISPNQKFTFQKRQFYHQWKYLIHTITQCLSPKSIGFNEFSSNIATTLVCLATNRVYNFSKMIFDDEPASPIGDDSQGEACPIVSGLKAEQDRENITKTSTLPHESTSRFTSIAADEGTQELEINRLKARIKLLEDKDGGVAEQSEDNAPIKGRRLDEGEEAAERVSDDTEEMATIMTSMDAASILTSRGVQVVPSAAEVATASVSITVGKEKMVESDTPKMKKLQEQIDVQVARELEEEMARDSQRMNEQIARDAEIARIHVEEELSKEEAERFKRKGLRLKQESVKKLKTSEEVKATEEVPEEKVKEMMQLVHVEEVYVESLQVKHLIIDWKVHTEGQRSYWKIIRLGGSSASYQFFVDMLKHFDREDLN